MKNLHFIPLRHFWSTFWQKRGCFWKYFLSESRQMVEEWNGVSCLPQVCTAPGRCDRNSPRVQSSSRCGTGSPGMSGSQTWCGYQGATKGGTIKLGGWLLSTLGNESSAKKWYRVFFFIFTLLQSRLPCTKFFQTTYSNWSQCIQPLLLFYCSCLAHSMGPVSPGVEVLGEKGQVGGEAVGGRPHQNIVL